MATARPAILAVDDDEMNLKIVDEILSDAGYDMVLVKDGQSAMDALANLPEIKVVLLDWMMPVMDGMEVLKKVRANPGYHDRVVMMLTALDTKDRVMEALQKGADDYIVKPFDAVKLIEKVRGALLLGRKRR